MNRYNPYLLTESHDDHGSASGSDEGSGYAAYGEAAKVDTDPEEESGSSLTSQTLNADGTPKRPMNAFMIFARRRRPQVSAENQSMRTGEISKILSKEWNSMAPHDKQFYLDQAKHLKETFNSRYPDYVYRRRPNNSRKRRPREGGPTRTGDMAQTSDPGDDLCSIGDLGESSHTDGEDTVTVDSRAPHDISTPSRGSFSSDGRFRPSASHEPYLSSSADRLASSIGTRLSPNGVESPRISHASQAGMHYGYQNMSGPSSFGADSASSWESRLQQARTQPNWQSSRPSPMSNDYRPKAHSYPGVSAASSSGVSASWSPNSGSSMDPQTQTAYSFPTLSSPFYPSSAFTSPPTATYGTAPMNGGETQTLQDRYYSSSPPLQPLYPPTNSAQQQQQQQPMRYHSASLGNTSSFPRGLPQMTQPLSGFNHAPTLTAFNSPPMGQMNSYWPRDNKIEGR